jgi:hypothetical protein
LVLIGFQVVEKIGASTVFDSVMPGTSSNRGHVDGDDSFDRLCVLYDPCWLYS